ncbi:MAG TPA: acyl carrier protein [Devosia sp.]|jgi:acyl carrier protein|uniref:acyl carrier protein n=1 Tax=Devosia sp. TaxID=1871048 RepID=UPI002DDC9B97|nr:acyl carrier protein [Devosia sp.]HEV2514414.1 acyl carrier protein [Devosia sp.]
MGSEARACAIVGDALNCPGAIGIGAEMNSVAAWDSLGHMAIVAGMERELGHALTAEQIASITSVRRVAELLEAL